MNYKLFCFLMINFVSISASSEQDHYKILNIAKTATVSEITKAYRKLAMEFHPDRNKNEGTQEIFKQINEAHEVLADTAKRRDYDSNLSPIFAENNSNVHFRNSDFHFAAHSHATRDQSSQEFKERSKAWEHQNERSLFARRSHQRQEPKFEDNVAFERNRNVTCWRDTDSV